MDFTLTELKASDSQQQMPNIALTAELLMQLLFACKVKWTN